MFKRFLPALALLVAPGVAAAQTLTFNTEEWFPYNYAKDGKVAGTATQIVERAAQAAQVPYTIALGPWNRAYNTALTQKDNCVYSTTVTDERKPLFKWVTPVETVKWVVYKAKGNALTAASMDDLKGKKIGGYVGDAVANYMKSQGFTVDEAPGDDANPKKLQAGRIDAWATTDISGIKLAKDAGVEIEKVIDIRENVMGLACNKEIDDATIAKLQAALDTLNSSGEAEKIRQSKF
ncbi:transporter substrate-binding domain-containing protein [Haematospirillum jordaniae]|uniref:Solute-binding protein family 3/N-terminal domain-containing protein n=1 Tax=Haematospirillum jordaniae TaxID=1549855 RepID=A0A143DDH3_9PROT|nr:transporter substrate-binding domain-containing protein [Haematospirillum jordaniae]AMW34767.1 hypothetical protein AY555_05765 [Haematospirillum jordaniae]NKD45487.1 transporter substrate-binding domain-containing protein [Haematospirillum jordaniae]NKD56872.1 transporter substrate-binding domain-containing protein [Haematospirillum jordaniae]NKD58972.1 transporter substrate-binding domain-containing protein [Haematospirillum jordaniae]NKD66797.1 transporter substrate-binding domain-contai